MSTSETDLRDVDTSPADGADSTSAAGRPGRSEGSSGGEYIVVARRYRPAKFAELVGQEQVAQALANAIETNRVGHAYLFTGARGVGKTSTARIFAKALNCERGPAAEPCNQCDLCLSIAHGDDVDVLEIDGASNRGIDEIRQLRSNVHIRPSRGRFKIYIVDEVHMLTTPAFNALLKTLEEPPEHVKFMFCTTDPEKIPVTVLSRCQRFDLPPVRSEQILERLRQIVACEHATIDEPALRFLARRAQGSMRDSQSLLEQLLSFCGSHVSLEDVHSMLGTAASARLTGIVQRLAERDPAGALEALDAAAREGVDPARLADQLVGHYRDLMAAAVGCDAEVLLHNEAEQLGELRETAQQLGLASLLAALQILDQTAVRLRQSTQPRILVELALVRICQLEQMESLAALAEALASGVGGGGGTAVRGGSAREATAGSAAQRRSNSPTPERAASGAPAAAGKPQATGKPQASRPAAGVRLPKRPPLSGGAPAGEVGREGSSKGEDADGSVAGEGPGRGSVAAEGGPPPQKKKRPPSRRSPS